MRIFQKGESVLTERCEEIDIKEFTPELFKDFRDTMIKNRGVGLAANQVGIQKRFFVAIIDGAFCAFINPSILSHGKAEIEEDEGCLSILKDGRPVYKPKKRWEVIDVKYQDQTGKFWRRTLKRFQARIFQHEMDHLDGRLCQE